MIPNGYFIKSNTTLYWNNERSLELDKVCVDISKWKQENNVENLS